MRVCIWWIIYDLFFFFLYKPRRRFAFVFYRAWWTRVYFEWQFTKGSRVFGKLAENRKSGEFSSVAYDTRLSVYEAIRPAWAVHVLSGYSFSHPREFEWDWFLHLIGGLLLARLSWNDMSLVFFFHVAIFYCAWQTGPMSGFNGWRAVSSRKFFKLTFREVVQYDHCRYHRH